MKDRSTDWHEYIAIAAVFLVAGLLIGGLGPGFFLSHGRLIISTLGALAILLLSAILLFVFCGKAITAKLFSVPRSHMDDVAGPLNETVSSYLRGDHDEVVRNAHQLGKAMYSKYIWISIRRFLIASAFGTVATVAGFATAVLLLEQNQLLRAQNEKLDSQNVLFNTEVELIESQTTLLEQQTSLAATTALTENSVSIRQLFDEILASQLQDQVDNDVENAPEPRSIVDAFQHKKRVLLTRAQSARLGFVTANLHPYAHDSVASNGLMQSRERGQVLLALHHLNVALESEVGSLNINSMDISKSQAIGLELTSFRIENACFEDADLRLGMFAVCDFKKCSFRGADLRMSAISNEIPRRGACMPCTCQSTDFSNADLRNSLLNTEFRDCCFTGANLEGAIIPPSIWENLQKQQGVDSSRWQPVLVGDGGSLPLQTIYVLKMTSGSDAISLLGDWIELHDLEAAPPSEDADDNRFQIPRPPWAPAHVLELDWTSAPMNAPSPVYDAPAPPQ
jgi:uncharacterized protein YjbI with pentapeptide repeats